MALYAIGDIQGCHSEFRDLLDLIGFDASRDRLWLVDDLVHAGLLPPWTAAQALALSREVEAMLASDRAREFLGVLYGDEPRQWRDDLTGYDRLRVIVNACTRLRFCT